MKMNNQARFSGRQKLGVIWVAAIWVSLVSLGSCSRPESNARSQATPDFSPQPVSSSLDVVKIQTERVAIAIGGNANATVLLSISTGFHINANPATFPYLIATELDVGNGFGIIVPGRPVYPIAQKKRFKFAEHPLAVYEGEARLTLPLRVTPKATKGPVSLPISVTVQACDEEKCYPPGMLNAMIPVEVK